MKVLLIEDDLNLGEGLEEYLSLNGVDVKWIKDDREVELVLLSQSFDVIVLDLILRYQRGEDILKRLRAKGVNTPVLILTAKKSLQDKERCFLAGADDYLTKPFAPKELLLRLQALERRQQREQTVKIGGVKIDLQEGVIYRGKEEVRVSPKAWQLLSFFLRHRGEILSTERILSYVWGDSPVGDEVVRAYVKELRKILSPEAIETYKGRGYRLK